MSVHMKVIIIVTATAFTILSVGLIYMAASPHRIDGYILTLCVKNQSDCPATSFHRISMGFTTSESLCKARVSYLKSFGVTSGDCQSCKGFHKLQTNDPSEWLTDVCDNKW